MAPARKAVALENWAPRKLTWSFGVADNNWILCATGGPFPNTNERVACVCTVEEAVCCVLLLMHLIYISDFPVECFRKCSVSFKVRLVPAVATRNSPIQRWLRDTCHTEVVHL